MYFDGSSSAYSALRVQDWNFSSNVQHVMRGLSTIKPYMRKKAEGVVFETGVVDEVRQLP